MEAAIDAVERGHLSRCLSALDIIVVASGASAVSDDDSGK